MKLNAEWQREYRETHKNISAENMRNYRKCKAQENKTPQASTSTEPIPTTIIYNYDEVNEYFQKNFIGNPFGYVCDMWQIMLYEWFKTSKRKMFKFLPRRGSEDMPIILTGDFNINVKGN
jgi:hypothetical protein